MIHGIRLEIKHLFHGFFISRFANYLFSEYQIQLFQNSSVLHILSEESVHACLLS